MIPFLDLNRSHDALRAEFEAAFQRVLDHGRFIMGPEVNQLEEMLANRLGVTHALGVSSGTDALLAVLMALEVGPGDEVIVPPLTFYATAGAVTRLGATPVFADVNPETLLLHPADTMRRVTPRTKAIIPVHLFGQCADVAPYRDAGLTVVEDAAQAMGATDEFGVQAGAQAMAGCFSFFPTKPLGGMGDGGLITTSNDELAERLRKIRVHGASPKFHHTMVGGNFRLDTLQAAMLLVKLPHLDDWNRTCQRLAQRYTEGLAPAVNNQRLGVLRARGGAHVHHQYVIRVPNRDALRAKLSDDAIGTAIYYPEPLHTQPCFAALGYKEGDNPHAETACAEVLALPCYPGLTDAEQDQVVQKILHYTSG